MIVPFLGSSGYCITSTRTNLDDRNKKPLQKFETAPMENGSLQYTKIPKQKFFLYVLEFKNKFSSIKKYGERRYIQSKKSAPSM